MKAKKQIKQEYRKADYQETECRNCDLFRGKVLELNEEIEQLEQKCFNYKLEIEGAFIAHKELIEVLRETNCKNCPGRCDAKRGCLVFGAIGAYKS